MWSTLFDLADLLPVVTECFREAINWLGSAEIIWEIIIAKINENAKKKMTYFLHPAVTGIIFLFFKAN
jgi:hypothetical protein